MPFYRIAKCFEVEYGHRLSKHPEKCRFPHGHSLKIEIVIRGRELDEHDMLCDYKALKTLVSKFVERLDHAMAFNSEDSCRHGFDGADDRVLLFEKADPTTEVLARWLFEKISETLKKGRWVEAPSGTRYHLSEDLELERIRVWETSTSWAEYVADDDG